MCVCVCGKINIIPGCTVCFIYECVCLCVCVWQIVIPEKKEKDFFLLVHLHSFSIEDEKKIFNLIPMTIWSSEERAREREKLSQFSFPLSLSFCSLPVFNDVKKSFLIYIYSRHHNNFFLLKGRIFFVIKRKMLFIFIIILLPVHYYVAN